MGYGAADKPLPALDPLARVTEVHWPANKYLTLLVTMSIKGDETHFNPFCEFSDHEQTAGMEVGLNYSTKIYLAYPPDSEALKHPGSVRLAKPDDNPDNRDRVSPSEVLVGNYPQLPSKEFGAWAYFNFAFAKDKPEGNLIKIKVGGPGNQDTMYVQGTSVSLTPYALPFSGPLGCWGATLGFPGDFGRPLPGNPSDWSSHTTAVGKLTVNFSKLRAVYKNRAYKVIGRYTSGPYGPRTNIYSLNPGGLAVSLLLERTNEKTAIA